MFVKITVVNSYNSRYSMVRVPLEYKYGVRTRTGLKFKLKRFILVRTIGIQIEHIQHK